jgi:hypothetical protein
MSRNLTTAAATAVAAEVVPRAMAVELNFGSGTVRLASTTYDLAIDGDDYLGVGQFGSIAVVEESAEIGSTSLVLSLSGIPRDMIAVALGEAYQNRTGAVFEVPLNATTFAPIADPIVLFRGRMDVMAVKITEGGATVEVQLTNRLVDWERPRRVLFSDEEHRRRAPADLSFRYASSMEEKEITWPTGQWFKVFI